MHARFVTKGLRVLLFAVCSCFKVIMCLLFCFCSDAIGRIRVLSVKTALSTLCAGRLVDKLRCKKDSFFVGNVDLNFQHPF